MANETWQDNFLDGLITLDQDEAPHGLYGICQAHTVADGWVPRLEQILFPPQGSNFLHYIGWKVGSRNFNTFTFETGESVWLRILDYASTKVRRFGDTYRLDLHNRKEPPVPEWNLEQLLGGLNKSVAAGRWASQGALLLVAHVANPKQIDAVLGRTTSGEFLSRHAISLRRREWEDRHGRGFLSALYLWSGLAPNAHGSGECEGGGTYASFPP